jgi:hypothetical protein
METETQMQCLIEDGQWRCTFFLSPKAKAASVNEQIPKAVVDAAMRGDGRRRQLRSKSQSCRH